ncbi:alpha/beta hydrolase [Nocardia alni]|uniref:alpha/beta hydrolase n=1 Tax=Nocardia alni TaxID=2815723 RepID=UPI001C235247|nr:alpha/beta fold hydrolase [Nocardia alni]
MAATDSTVVRRDVWFDSGEDRCAAWLYETPGQCGRRPVVVMGHGLGAVRQMRLDAYAERFAARGWSVLVFDYRYLGASGGQPRQLLDIGRQLADWRAALEYVRALPGVDPARIAVWGSSFGGGHALRTGARDPGVAAVVAQCPFTDGPASMWSRFRGAPASALALTAAAVIDTIGSWFGARPLLVPMAGTGWMPAFLTSPDALPGAAALLPPGTRVSARTSAALGLLPAIRDQLPADLVLTTQGQPSAGEVGRDSIWGSLSLPGTDTAAANALAARLALRLPWYRPGRDMARIQAPTLVCVCEHDVAAPAAATIHRAAGLDHVQVLTYPCAHFDIYLGEYFERAVTDQLAFLSRAFGEPPV